MNFDHLDYHVEDGIARLTLHRPDVLNSFNRSMGSEVQRALADCAERDDVRVVVLTGAGRAFCAGQDLADVVPGDGEESLDLSDVVRGCFNPIILGIRTLEKPVIAAVNGVAAGAGANLALACDFVIATEKAAFIQSFSQVGLVPDSGGTFLLPRLVGMARATALMMLAEKIRAPEAAEMGMIYKSCPADTFESDVNALATRLSQMPTRGLGLTKQLLQRSFESDLAVQLEREAEGQGEAGRTEDYAEGVNAFLEKRPPVFTGR